MHIFQTYIFMFPCMYLCIYICVMVGMHQSTLWYCIGPCAVSKSEAWDLIPLCESSFISFLMITSCLASHITVWSFGDVTPLWQEITLMHSNVWVVIPHSEHVHLCDHAQTISTGSEIPTLGIHHDTLPQVPSSFGNTQSLFGNKQSSFGNTQSLFGTTQSSEWITCSAAHKPVFFWPMIGKLPGVEAQDNDFHTCNWGCPLPGFLYKTTFMVPVGVRILWASSRSGIPISGMSCSGSGDPNSGGGGHTCAPQGCVTSSPSSTTLLGSRACSLHVGGHVAATWVSWGLPRSIVSFSGVRDASGWSSTGSSSMVSRMSSSADHIRLAMQSWRSLAVLHIMW